MTDQLKAGRELDRRLAVLQGFRMHPKIDLWYIDENGIEHQVPFYSTEIDAALKLVSNFDFVLYQYAESIRRWCLKLTADSPITCSTTLPMAICTAFVNHYDHD